MVSEAVGRAALAAGGLRVVFTSTATVTGYAGPERQTGAPARRTRRTATRASGRADLRRIRTADGLDVVVVRLPQTCSGRGRATGRKGSGSCATAESASSRKAAASIRATSTTSWMRSDAARRRRASRGDATCSARPRRAGRGCCARSRSASVCPSRAHRVVGALQVHVALGNLVYRWTRVGLPHPLHGRVLLGAHHQNTARARAELGWTPPDRALRQSVVRTVSWLREQRLVWTERSLSGGAGRKKPRFAVRPTGMVFFPLCASPIVTRSLPGTSVPVRELCEHFPGSSLEPGKCSHSSRTGTEVPGRERVTIGLAQRGKNTMPVGRTAKRGGVVRPAPPLSERSGQTSLCSRSHDTVRTTLSAVSMRGVHPSSARARAVS